MISKYNLILCELYNQTIHGLDENSDPNIQTHYILIDKYEPFSETYIDNNEVEDDYDDPLTDMQSDILSYNEFYVRQMRIICFNMNPSPIRNYRTIVSRPNYIQREIGEVIILPTFEEIAILKTFWIRMIQKKWKKVYQQRKIIINRRMTPSSIYYWQVNGKWPPDCIYLPTLNGLFYSVLFS
jgi:hypothetical protein